VLLGHLRGGHSELGKPVSAAGVLVIREPRCRIKIAHFPGDLAVISLENTGIEMSDAALSGDKILPKRIEMVADRRNHSDTCDYDSALHKTVGEKWLNCLCLEVIASRFLPLLHNNRSLAEKGDQFVEL
jgi:hypothetical protein